MAAAVAPPLGGDVSAVRLEALNFAYPGCAPSVRDVSLDLPRGARCLLIGANGAGEGVEGNGDCPLPAAGAPMGRGAACSAAVRARAALLLGSRAVCGPRPCDAARRSPARRAGKTTLLQLLAGKYMVGRSVITVLGRSPFYDLVRAGRPLLARAAGCAV